jgi:hypothetical protein
MRAARDSEAAKLRTGSRTGSRTGEQAAGQAPLPLTPHAAHAGNGHDPASPLRAPSRQQLPAVREPLQLRDDHQQRPAR